MVEVTIQMSPPPGVEEPSCQQGLYLAELRRWLKGYEVEPLHPGSTDPLLCFYFRAQVPDSKSAAEVVETLRDLSLVTAAYVKPRDEMP